MSRRITMRAAEIVLTALVAIMAVAVCGAQVIDRVIAVVSGTVIMLSDARAALTLGLVDPDPSADPVAVAMHWLIDRQLVLDEASRSDRVNFDTAALNRAMGQVRGRFGSDSDYQRALAGLGLDDAGVQRLVHETLVAREYVERRFDSMPSASDEELRQYYSAHADRFRKNGRRMGFDEALPDVTAALQQERRDQAVSAWMERLRRRTDIREIYRASR